MRYVVISIISVISLFSAHVAFALDYRIKSYSQLSHSLESGYEVRAVTDFGKCTSTEKLNGNPIGGLNFDQFLRYQIKDEDGNAREAIATSSNMLIRHPQFGMVYNYVRLRVFADDSVQLYSELIDPKSFTMLNQKTFQCRISNGDDKNGLSLFTKLF